MSSCQPHDFPKSNGEGIIYGKNSLWQCGEGKLSAIPPLRARVSQVRISRGAAVGMTAPNKCL